MRVFLHRYADQIGIAASGLCLVHCLLMPFILTIWLQSDRCAAHAGCCDKTTGFNYDYLFLAFSALAVWLASGHCSRRWVKIMMWTCFVLLAGGLFLEYWFEGAHHAMILAAVGLAVSHLLNWRYCRQCNPHKS
ncbi:MAG: MerC domain-containing protein [Saprospiraceae bacterium]